MRGEVQPGVWSVGSLTDLFSSSSRPPHPSRRDSLSPVSRVAVLLPSSARERTGSEGNEEGSRLRIGHVPRSCSRARKSRPADPARTQGHGVRVRLP